jgi:hypothetical protein
MGESSARRRRTAGSLAFVVLVTCLVTGLFVPAARASCPGPTMSVGAAGTTPTPTVAPSPPGLPVRAGDGVAVVGTYFLDGCDDVQSCQPGCSGCQSVNPSDPIPGLQLVMVTPSGEQLLGERDADGDQGDVRWDVVVPAGTPPGPAKFQARWPTGPTIDAVMAEVQIIVS